MAFGIGIDLGTTNSCAAVVRSGEAQVIEDPSGQRIQPSVLTFDLSGKVIAGVEAKQQMLVDDHNAVYSFKRLLGRTLDEPETSNLVEELHYDVIAGPGGAPVVKVAGRELSLPELSAIMLGHIRDVARDSLDAPVEKVVITVPANFTDVQRAMTKVAGRIAGLDVLRILNEPTAAALAYGLGQGRTERVAIYDFGGGTFDITTVELTDDIFEVLSTSGDSYLGGDDFDELIAADIREQLRKDRDVDVTDDPSAMAYIRTVAEDTKIRLSDEPVVESLVQGVFFSTGETMAANYVYKLDRESFDRMATPLVMRSLSVCEEALKLAGLAKGQIDSLVMVGGSTRMPLVRKKTAEYFGLTPRTEINPDEVVALGAALHAYALTGVQAPDAPIAAVQELPPSEEMFVVPETPDSPPAEAIIESLPPDSALASLPAEAIIESLPPDSLLESLPPDALLESLPPEDVTGGFSAEVGAANEADPAVASTPRMDNLPQIAPEPAPARVPVRKAQVKAPGGMKVGEAQPALLLDVTPRALGIETAGGFCETIIDRNAAIPVEQSRVFTTSHSDQTEVAINVFQGESRRADENAKLGTVVLSGIRSAVRGAIRIRVKFEINTDGILELSARNEETGEAQTTRIELSGGLDEKHIEQLVARYAKK